jgi:eukaryotic-like serine/threonine-protein kinase
MAAAGDKIAGFVLVRRLGAGGMGEIWEAVRRVGRGFEQRVAIKIINRESLGTREGQLLFQREASLTASLRHPNIAAVLDVGEGFIVHELVEGADFRSVLREAPSHRLTPPLLVLVLYQVARGLAYAHNRVLHGRPSPVVHRDMSPANIVIDYDGNSKVVDFGIAKATDAVTERSDNIRGKLAYMAPEQATAQEVDGRADQYALGVIAYEAITGQRPNDGAHDGETLANILNGTHVPVTKRAPDIPAGLGEIIERTLCVNREDRFASMEAVIDALGRFSPPLTAYRDLAALVAKAHPPHTIELENGRFVSRPITLAPKPPVTLTDTSLASAVSAPPPLGASSAVRPLTRTVSMHPTPERAVAQVGLPIVLPQPAPSEPARAKSRMTTIRWLSAVAAIAAAATTAWLALTREPDPASTGTEAAPSPALMASPRDQTPAKLGPARPDPSASGDTPPLVLTAELSAEPEPAEPAPGAPPSAQTKSASETQPAEAPGAKPEPERRARKSGKGRVRVGVFPTGNVWINGRPRGAAPLTVELGAGRHVIGAGSDRPVKTERVEVKPDQEQSVVITLSGSPSE